MIKTVFLTGPVGHGKSSLATLLIPRIERFFQLKVNAIMAGARIYLEIKNQTPLGIKIKPFIDAGFSLPQEYVLEIIAPLVDHREGVLNFFEGMPRNPTQLKWEQFWWNETVVILLKILPFTTIVKRTERRKICKLCYSSFESDRCFFCKSREWKYREIELRLLFTRYYLECRDYLILKSRLAVKKNKLILISNETSLKQTLNGITARLIVLNQEIHSKGSKGY